MATGFGLDTHCTDRYRSGRFVSGAELLGQALFRRAITPRGTLQGVTDEDDELTYGFDVAGYVGAVGYPAALAAIPAILDAEFEKDDRVVSSSTAAAQVTSPNGEIEIVLTSDVLPVDESEAFTLTLSVNDVTLELLGIETVPA